MLFYFFSVIFVWILRVGHKIKNILYSIVPTFSAFLLFLSLKISVFLFAAISYDVVDDCIDISYQHYYGGIVIYITLYGL